MSEARSALHAQYAEKFRELQAQTRVVTDTYPKLRMLYVQGSIECEEFEERLDVLLRWDPDALDRKPPGRGTPTSSMAQYFHPPPGPLSPATVAALRQM